MNISDFENHLTNLAKGRACQNPLWHGSLAQSPVLPQYTQEHRPWEVTERSIHPNVGMPSHMHDQGFVLRYPYF